MKQPIPASQKKNKPKKPTDASSLFCRCYLGLCSPTSAFEAPAGGDALSSAPWLLHALLVSLSSAGITLQTHFPYAACFWSFAVRLQVCVWRGWTGYMWSKHCSSVTGGSFLLTLQPSSAHPRIFGRHFIPFIERVLGEGFGKRIRNSWKGRCCVFVS